MLLLAIPASSGGRQGAMKVVYFDLKVPYSDLKRRVKGERGKLNKSLFKISVS